MMNDFNDPPEFVKFQLRFEVLRDGLPLEGWQGITPGIGVTPDFLSDAFHPYEFINNSLLNDLRAILNEIGKALEGSDER